MIDPARTPRYQLRTSMALRVIGMVEPVRVLEAGCGDGAFLVELAKRGLQAVGVEPGAEAFEGARKRVAAYPGLSVVRSWSSAIGHDFDCLVALEVLEHLEDALGHLKLWLTHLRPGGTAIVSVPAHMRLWSDVDVAVGHYRRYSRMELSNLLEAAGLSGVRVWSYGFPLTSISSTFRRRHTTSSAHGETPTTRTLSSAAVSYSGLGQSNMSRRLLRWAGTVGHAAQMLFRGTELGDGWVGMGTKPTP